jgi:hypothetical protein
MLISIILEKKYIFEAWGRDLVIICQTCTYLKKDWLQEICFMLYDFTNHSYKKTYLQLQVADHQLSLRAAFHGDFR